MTQTNTASALNAIKVRFVESLDTRLAEIETLYLMLGNCEHPEQVFREIGMRAHRIAGISGTLGYPLLGQVSGRVDDAIQAVISRPSADTIEPALEEIEMLLADIDALMEAMTD